MKQVRELCRWMALLDALSEADLKDVPCRDTARERIMASAAVGIRI